MNLAIEIAARDAAIRKLAEYYDDEMMEAEFHSLVRHFRQEAEDAIDAHALATALAT